MTPSNQKVIVAKLNIQREETWCYEGQILKMQPNSLLIEAFFNREDLPFHGITLREQDRFIERYYSDRWYNIFEIHDRDDNRLKGWYCNVTRPAEFSPGKIAYVDLALDLLVYPNGEYLVLDEAEFLKLPLFPASRDQARQALRELIGFANENRLRDLIN
jgi:uncharacterized protein